MCVQRIKDVIAVQGTKDARECVREYQGRSESGTWYQGCVRVCVRVPRTQRERYMVPRMGAVRVCARQREYQGRARAVHGTKDA